MPPPAAADPSGERALVESPVLVGGASLPGECCCSRSGEIVRIKRTERERKRKKMKKKKRKISPVSLVVDPVSVVTDVLSSFLRPPPGREDGFTSVMPQPQPPLPFVLVPVGALERALPVPEAPQSLPEVAAAVGEAELAVDRSRRRQEAGLPSRDVLGCRDEGGVSSIFVVEVELVSGVVAGVGVEGVEPGRICFSGMEVRRRRMKRRKKGKKPATAVAAKTLALSFLSRFLTLTLRRRCCCCCFRPRSR